MARDFAVIEAEVLAANPTPAFTWYLHMDNPGHHHDDQSVARAELNYDGDTYIFEAHILDFQARSLGYHGRMVVQETEQRVPASPAAYDTWAEMKVGMAAAIEARFVAIRKRMTAEILAGEQLADDGVVAAPVNPVRLTGLRVSAVADLSLMLSPAFAAQTFAYSLSTAIPEVMLRAIAPTGATVRWTHGAGAGEGSMITVSLLSGANVIACTVSQPGSISTTYTVTIRHPRQ